MRPLEAAAGDCPDIPLIPAQRVEGESGKVPPLREVSGTQIKAGGTSRSVVPAFPGPGRRSEWFPNGVGVKIVPL